MHETFHHSGEKKDLVDFFQHCVYVVYKAEGMVMVGVQDVGIIQNALYILW